MRTIDVANAVIINSDNKILLTQRFDLENPAIHLKWQLPGGGIEKGEAPHDACVREAFEETGLHVKLLSENPFKISQKYEKEIFNLNVFLACPLSDTINTSLDPETNDAAWYEMNEIKGLSMLDNTIDMIEGCIKIWKKH